jgi:hypothetical protein
MESKFVNTQRVFMTAELARNLLRRNIENNRPIQEGLVKDYARDMKNNRWKENGSTIVVSGPSLENPVQLVDGQKRLTACIEAGVGFWTLVAFNVTKEAFITIDRGQRRSPGQQLHLETGIHDYNAVAATVGYLYRFRDGIMLSNGRPTQMEVSEILAMNPGIPESVLMARGIIHRFKAGPIPVIAVCHYLFTRQDATLAEVFFDNLATGAHLREVDPVYHLRARIINASASSAKRITQYELLALFFKVWNAEREQTMMRTLRWAPAEPFPNIGPIESIRMMRPEKKTTPSAGAGRRKRRQSIQVPEPTPEVKASPEKKEEKKYEPPTKLDLLIQKHKGLDKR